MTDMMTKTVEIKLANAKITPEIVRMIRSEYRERLIDQKGLAAKYKLSQGSISNIVRRKTWGHVED